MRRITHHRWAVTTTSLVAVAALTLAGCSDSSTDAAADSEGGSDSDMTVAMVTPESTGEFYGTMYCGAKAAAAEQDVKLDIQGTPEVTVDAEMQVLQSVLATEPDGMLLTVWDNDAFNTVMGEYTSAGHPLVMPDSMLNSDDYIQSIRTDSYQSSYDAAIEVIDSLGLTSGKVLVLTDSPGNAIQTARAEGFRDAVEAESDLDMLEFQYVSGDSAKASSALTSAAAANDDLALVFTTNGGAGTGAANGIATVGTDIPLIGYDTFPSQVEQLEKGQYDALIAQSPYQMGFDAMTLVSKILKGEESADDVTEQTVWSPWMLVTADNVESDEAKPFLYSSSCS